VTYGASEDTSFAISEGTLEVIEKKTGRLQEAFAYAKTIYRSLPVFVRLMLWPVEKIYWVLSVLRLDFWILQGNEIASKQKLDILYAGTEQNRSLLMRLAFSGPITEIYMGKKWVWAAGKILKNNGSRIALTVIEVPQSFKKFFAHNNNFFVPNWVYGEVDISVDISIFMGNKSLNSDVRRIRKNGLTYEISRDLDQLQKFYSKMYVPHITGAHGRESVIFNYDSMKEEFKNGELLLVTKKGESIGGMVIIYSNHNPRLWCLGIKDGNRDYVIDGVIGALFYFSVKYLKEKGFATVDFDASRSFLKGGVLQYKKKWGMKIVNATHMGMIFRPLVKTDGLKHFLINNPFIYMRNKEFDSAIFVEEDRLLTDEDLNEFHKMCYLEGISRMLIYQFGQKESHNGNVVTEERSGKFTMSSAESLFIQ
jgi:hypothetical protein